jgi:hypothetical protein
MLIGFSIIKLTILGLPIYGNAHLVGGFNPCEKYESQLGVLFPIYGES